jgi:hypothetical protein
LPGVSNEQRAPQVDVIRGWTCTRPGLETENDVMTIGRVAPPEDAPRIAKREPVGGMGADHGFDELNVYIPLSQAGRIRFKSIVDRKMAMGASTLKKYPVS